MYALMFQVVVPEGRKLFTFAGLTDAGTVTLLAEESEAAVRRQMMEAYGRMARTSPTAVVSHGLSFRPVTVSFDDEQSFLRNVVGEEETHLCEVRTQAGAMTGIECHGPSAVEAYSHSTPVPWLSVFPEEGVPEGVVPN